jgi:uncharacterized membrane protein YdbT with pleckstrin-like domain
MSYVEKLLARNEHIERIVHEHWITLLPAVLVDAAVSTVIIALSVLGIILSPPWTWFGLLLLIVPLGHLAHRIWEWRNKQYVVTNWRIIQVTGTFDKQVSDTLLEKINDIMTQQSGLGRLLDFGTIKIISGSEVGADVFYRIADPVGFKKELLEQKASHDSPGGSGEQAEPTLGGEASSADHIPDLIAELDELRHKGIITDAEFQEKKKQLLAKI